MNIVIPDSWLREFLKTRATPSQIAQYLSLCGPSVEKFVKVKKDYLYHIEVTSNRPDAFSVFGIAREAAAILPRFGVRTKLTTPIGIDFTLIPQTRNKPTLKVKITKKSLVPRFAAIILSNVKVGPSPKLIQERLLTVGIRPVNNVVDVSNYLMYELGQPMHTFDYDQIKDGQMILRESREGEEIETLDEMRRKLPKGAIVIEDKGRLIDLCGLMGGANSQVQDETQNVLLFVQVYNPVKIRQTCKLLKFRTEAAARFEKGIDQEGVIPALRRAAYLICQNAQASISSELIDIYQKPPAKSTTLTFKKLDQVLGIKIAPKEVTKILSSLGFEIKSRDKQKIVCAVPSFRLDDIEIEEDLVEEVARIYGYFNLNGVVSTGTPPALKQNPIFKIETQIRYLLKHLGFFEIYTNSQISRQDLTDFGFQAENFLKVLNPLSADQQYLRPTLLPSLTKTMLGNYALKPKLSLFEIANVYWPKSRGLPEERSMLCLAQLGADYFKTKGITEAIFAELAISDIKFTKIEHQIYQNAAGIFYYSLRLGTLGTLAANFGPTLQFAEPINFAEIEMTSLVKLANQQKPFRAISKYPQSTEDVAVIVNSAVTIAEIEQLLKSAKIVNLARVEVYDVFEDPKFGVGKKSITLQLVFGSMTRTLKLENVAQSKQKVIKLLGKHFQAQVRTETN